ncbi:MAG: calcineurin-like phosphoesterase C-terminal domain-containing protein [Planctomycetota bacterium]|jgi:hypothetical protein
MNGWISRPAMCLVCRGVLAAATLLLPGAGARAQTAAPDKGNPTAVEPEGKATAAIAQEGIAQEGIAAGGTPQGGIAQGFVFDDRNGDGRRDPADLPLAGVRVSNGLEIVRTDEQGRYQLPLGEEGQVFVIKPSGYRTRIGPSQLPQFYYLHRPSGSPQLRFAGVAPSGPLPQSIDFPLTPQQEPEVFRMILFGDTQPRNLTEVDYIAHDVVADARRTEAAFGVTLGDIAFDDLNVIGPLTEAISLIGIPWYNVFGNHDANFDATTRRYINETFERHFGPSYYSFDHGKVHFVVLDNIDYVPTPEGKFGFKGGFGEEQLNWLKRDLEAIPAEQMVVLLMHIPLNLTGDHQALFRLIEQRPFALSISAHQHYHQHLFLGEQQGWKGKQPHHHIINVTVCGSWWSGVKDERGIPHATMSDGAPNGYSVMTFDGEQYSLEFIGAGNDRGRQMRIELANEVPAEKTTRFHVNVFDGSSRSRVWFSLNGREWTECQQVEESDPQFQRLWEAEQQQQPPPSPKLTKPTISSHLWAGELPSGLTPGTHLLRVRTVDLAGKEYTDERSFRVVPTER